MTDKRIKSYLEDRLKRLESIKNERRLTTAELGDIACCKQTLAFIDSLQEEPVSEDLEEAARRFVTPPCALGIRTFKAGAKWQKTHLWKPADGNDLPEYEREVVVFTQPYPLENSEYVVSFAHRPNPDGWDGKSLATGKINTTHQRPMVKVVGIFPMLSGG